MSNEDAFRKVLDLWLHPDVAIYRTHSRDEAVLAYDDCPAFREAREAVLREHEPHDRRESADATIEFAGRRWRAHVSHAMDGWSVKLRHLPKVNLSVNDLGFDYEGLMSLARSPGIFIVGGPTSSGKSTTASAVVQELNKEGLLGHMVTVEEPIEFVYPDLPRVRQREVGADVHSFAQGVRDAMRETPDTILIGEIRDPKTAEDAVQAGLTGHRVITTIHADDITEVIQRMFAFLDDQHDELLPRALQGIHVQHLIPRQDRVPLPLSEGILVNREVQGTIAEANTNGLQGLNLIRHAMTHQRRPTMHETARRMAERGQVPEGLIKPYLDEER